MSSISSNSLHNIFWIENKSSLCWFRVEGIGHQLLVCYLFKSEDPSICVKLSLKEATS
jgi:hypothetical protein